MARTRSDSTACAHPKAHSKARIEARIEARVDARPGRPVCAGCGIEARDLIPRGLGGEGVCAACGEPLPRRRWLVWPAAGSRDRRAVLRVLIAHLALVVAAHAAIVTLGWLGTDWRELVRQHGLQQRSDVRLQLGVLAAAGLVWLALLLGVLLRSRRLVHGSRRLPLSLLLIALLAATAEWGFVAVMALTEPAR